MNSERIKKVRELTAEIGMENTVVKEEIIEKRFIIFWGKGYECWSPDKDAENMVIGSDYFSKDQGYSELESMAVDVLEPGESMNMITGLGHSVVRLR